MATAFSNFVDGPPISVAGGGTVGLTITMEPRNSGQWVYLGHTSGVTVTLPASSGDGSVYRFLVTALPSGTTSHIVKVGNTVDVLQGVISSAGTSGTTKAWTGLATTDTITLAGVTGAATVGDWLEVRDLTAGVFVARGQVTYVGTGLTPFGSTVN